MPASGRGASTGTIKPSPARVWPWPANQTKQTRLGIVAGDDEEFLQRLLQFKARQIGLQRDVETAFAELGYHGAGVLDRAGEQRPACIVLVVTDHQGVGTLVKLDGLGEPGGRALAGAQLHPHPALRRLQRAAPKATEEQQSQAQAFA